VKVRFLAMAWDWGVTELERLALPSLLQPDNIPWLLRHGFQVTFTVYGLDRDARRLGDVLDRAFAPVANGSLAVNAALLRSSENPTSFHLKQTAFVAESRKAIEEGAALALASADLFFGNGSIRNIATYCRKPGVAAGGVCVRVRREPFLDLLRRHREAFGAVPISNARLVDMALQSLLECWVISDVDKDCNASYETAISMRRVAPDVFTLVHKLPTPVMWWPQESDLHFFETHCYGGRNFDSLDHLWPAQLIAQRRWRLLASSDLFFFVEVSVDESQHVYAPQPNMRYNERFRVDLPHTHMHEQVVVTLRREPYLGEESTAD
jgi:hypothetical protein